MTQYQDPMADIVDTFDKLLDKHTFLTTVNAMSWSCLNKCFKAMADKEPVEATVWLARSVMFDKMLDQNSKDLALQDLHYQASRWTRNENGPGTKTDPV